MNRPMRRSWFGSVIGNDNPAPREGRENSNNPVSTATETPTKPNDQNKKAARGRGAPSIFADWGIGLLGRRSPVPAEIHIGTDTNSTNDDTKKKSSKSGGEYLHGVPAMISLNDGTSRSSAESQINSSMNMNALDGEGRRSRSRSSNNNLNVTIDDNQHLSERGGGGAGMSGSLRQSGQSLSSDNLHALGNVTQVPLNDGLGMDVVNSMIIPMKSEEEQQKEKRGRLKSFRRRRNRSRSKDSAASSYATDTDEEGFTTDDGGAPTSSGNSNKKDGTSRKSRSLLRRGHKSRSRSRSTATNRSADTLDLIASDIMEMTGGEHKKTEKRNSRTLQRLAPLARRSSRSRSRSVNSVDIMDDLERADHLFEGEQQQVPLAAESSQAASRTSRAFRRISGRSSRSRSRSTDSVDIMTDLETSSHSKKTSRPSRSSSRGRSTDGDMLSGSMLEMKAGFEKHQQSAVSKKKKQLQHAEQRRDALLKEDDPKSSMMDTILGSGLSLGKLSLRSCPGGNANTIVHQVLTANPSQQVADISAGELHQHQHNQGGTQQAHPTRRYSGATVHSASGYYGDLGNSDVTSTRSCPGVLDLLLDEGCPVEHPKQPEQNQTRRHSGMSTTGVRQLDSSFSEKYQGTTKSERQRQHQGDSTRRRNSHTDHVSTKIQQDELLMEWPTSRNSRPQYPSTIISEHANDRLVKTSSGSAAPKKKGGLAGNKSALSLPDMIDDFNDDLEQYPQQREQKPNPSSNGGPASNNGGQPQERAQRRHSSCSLDMLMGTAPTDQATRRPRKTSTKKKLRSSLKEQGTTTKLTQSKPSPSSKNRKRVHFSQIDSMQYYEKPDMNIKKLFYSRDDDRAFSDLTVKHARSIRSYIKSSITKDETFNSLTGLPSPEVLKKHILAPEDIIGIEHLLCGRGIAKASLNLKMNHTRVLLEEQNKWRAEGKFVDPSILCAKMEKYSSITATLAVCRASYAAMV